VLDPSGAVIPGATVVVKNERTGEQRSVTSNAEGRYMVANLRPSVYTIKASFGELAPLEFTGLQLVAAQEFPLDLSLNAAGITETVQVTANVGAVDISSARIGVNVSEREINELPVNGRQMSQLMLQAPGSQNAGTGTWNDVRFSGRANNQNVIKFDGVEGSAIIDASPGNVGGQIASPFKLQASLENVQEFRVESNNYPAEFGTGTGGQVSVITKSGSNQFHGSFFEYYRNDKLDAPNYFDSTRNSDGSVIQELPKSKLNQHQFGGSFGGPLKRDRTFFFFSYDQNEEQRDKSKAAFDDPAVNPNGEGRRLLDILQNRFGLTGEGGAGVFMPQTNDARVLLGKVDTTLSPAHRASIRYAYSSAEQVNGTFDVPTWTTTANAVHFPRIVEGRDGGALLSIDVATRAVRFRTFIDPNTDSPPLAVAPDESFAIYARIDRIGVDLMEARLLRE
jgi:hypothetical protein